ncbi:cytochrome P450 1A4-like [Paroedura picta]|uniref:cytochrome P450 1A4-like n=1 Tax=Paroedura picta TaxID=143630 RepID=UPI004055B23A
MEAAPLETQGVLPVTDLLIACSISCLVLMIAKTFWKPVPQGLKRLPGPRGYPLVGNVPDLGKDPHLALTEMSQHYGDVMQIQLGTRPVLVLSGLETIRQALVKQGEDFMGRPDLYSFQFISEGQSLTFGHDSGETWRASRKLAQSALKTFSASPSPNSASCLLEEHVSNEADYLILKFLELMKAEKGFDPSRYIVISVANVICAMCFGKRYGHDDQELLSIVNMSTDFGEAAASGNPSDFIPILRYLPNRTMRTFRDLNRRFATFMLKLVRDHYTTFDKEHLRDITDSLIDHCQDKVDENGNVQCSDQKIVNLVGDLFGAGFDTVTTALSWSLMYLVTYPEIQKKIQEEIDQVIGRERKPRLADRSVLPYTEAFMLEMFRHSSFLPFTIPHCTTRDTALSGFYIPKNTCVFVNQWQVNHDAKLWKDPSSFRPERFLTADGAGINRLESEKVLSFGLGKRRCIGESIGRGEVFLFLTTLLQKLEFSLRQGQTADITPLYGLTMKHKKCEHFQIRQRF